MAYYKVRNTGLDNETLSLWLKARDGLSCEDARDLIQQLVDARAEAEEDARRADENMSAARQEEHDAGREEGWYDLRGRIQRAMDDAEGETADHDALQAIQNILSNDSP